MRKEWKIKDKVGPTLKSGFPEIHPIILQLLVNRGIDTQEKIDEFMNPDYLQDIHDPFLFRQMKKAVEILLSAVDKNEKVLVYGDYDADGITSSALLYEILGHLGADFEVYIPHRETEGYGLNPNIVDKFVDQGIRLLITVDCGITNINEIKTLVEKGVKVIITDHHKPLPDLPLSCLIINPNLSNEQYPFKHLSGVGVAFKFAQAIIKSCKKKNLNKEGIEKWLLDLVAIGTVSDMSPLIGENRTLVKYGLIVLNKTNRPGLKQLIDASKIKKNKELNAMNIGFHIGPKLNASGRLEHANESYKLLIEKDEQKVKTYVEKLNKINESRQRITEKVFCEVKTIIENNRKKENILIAVGDNWPVGVVGLVAGKITDQYYLPSLIIGRYEQELKGSGRSIEEFDIVRALQQCSEFLSRFGGHPGACGFTLKSEKMLSDFIRKMKLIAGKTLGKQKLAPKADIDMELTLKDLNWEIYDSIRELEPYGEGNPAPLFLFNNVLVNEIGKVGGSQQHLKIVLKDPDSDLKKKAIAFNFSHLFDILKPGDSIAVVAEIICNEWNGNRELELKINDIKKNE